MNRRIIISEEEKNRILEKHNRVLEQDRKSTYGSGIEQDYVQTSEPKLPTQQTPQQPPANNDFRFYDPKTYQSPQTSPLQAMINANQPQTPEKTVEKPIAKTPVKQKKVVSKGGGQQQQQQQPAKIDNYQVYGIQDILNKKFGLGLSPDGKWGPKTAQAVLDKLAPAQTTPQTAQTTPLKPVGQ
jgi:hypothetical protein